MVAVQGLDDDRAFGLAALFFLFIVCIPSLVYVVAPVGSLAAGILLIALLTLLIARPTLPIAVGSVAYAILLALTTLLTDPATLSPSLQRSVIQPAAHGLLVCSAVSLGCMIQRAGRPLSWESARKAALYANLFFLVIGFATLVFRPTMLGYEAFRKNILPFAEPSHYVLAAAPLMISSAVYLPRPVYAVLLSLYFIIAIYQPSLIMIAIILVCAAILIFRVIFIKESDSLKYNSSKKYLYVISLLIFSTPLFNSLYSTSFNSKTPVAVETRSTTAETPTTDLRTPTTAVETPSTDLDTSTTTVEAPSTNLDIPTTTVETPSRNLAVANQRYFLDRIAISAESSNLTVLIFLQGWEDALYSLTRTTIGYGFQSMGSQPPGEIAERIRSIDHIYRNRNDGGSLAPKIVFEFGYVGVVFVVAAVGFALFSLWQIATTRAGRGDPAILFAYCLCASFMFELLLRGYGYFSPGVFLAIVGFTVVQRSRRAALP